jgi:hypothetical protein
VPSATPESGAFAGGQWISDPPSLWRSPWTPIDSGNFDAAKDGFWQERPQCRFSISPLSL